MGDTVQSIHEQDEDTEATSSVHTLAAQCIRLAGLARQSLIVLACPTLL